MRWVWIFFLCLSAAASPVKLALLGNRPLCDKTMEELSASDQFDLLERAEIDKVLQEHRLSSSDFSAGVLRRCFPHTDLFAVLTEKRLVVFNAKNGFRLWDDSPEDAAQKILKAKNKLAVKDPLYLSIVSVRDVGVPGKLKPKIEEFVMHLEQALIKLPAIQMLERARLDAVNTERELAGPVFALTPSARLLTLEFEPGSTGDKTHARILILTLDRRIVGRVNVHDVFNKCDEQAIVCGKELYQKITGPAQEQRSSEGMQFARESMELFRNGRFGEALSRIHSALALEPQNEAFRLLELEIRTKLCTSMPWNSERIRAMEELMNHYEAYIAAYPDAERMRIAFTALCEAFTVKNRAQLQDMTASDRRELRRLGETFRRFRSTARRTVFPSPLPERMENIADLIQYNRRTWFGPFLLAIDLEGELNENLEEYRKFFPAVDAFIRRHPEQAERVNSILALYHGHLMRGELARQGEWEPYIRQTLPIVDFLEKSQITAFRYECIAIRFLARLLDKPRTPAVLIPEIDRYLQELAKCDPEALPQIEQTRLMPENLVQNINNRTFYFLTAYTGDDTPRNVAHLIRERARKLNPNRDANSHIREWIENLSRSTDENTLEKLIAFRDPLTDYARQRVFSKQTNDWFTQLGEIIFSESENTPAILGLKQRLFTQLNRDLQVRRIAWRELTGSGNEAVECIASDVSGGKLVAVLRRAGNRFFLAEVTLPDQCRILGELKSLTPLNTELYPKRGASVYLAASDEIVAVVDRNTLRMYDRKENRMKMADDPLGGIHPSGAAIQGNRIYLLGSGRAAFAGETRTREKRHGASALVSYDFYGAGRETIFSTERVEKRNPLDFTAARIELYTGLRAFGENELVFFSEKAVWKYHTRRRSFQKVLSFPVSVVRSTVIDGTLYFTSTNPAYQFSCLEPNSEKLNFLLGFSPYKPRIVPQCLLDNAFLFFDTQYPFRNADQHFFRQRNWLFIAGSRPFCLNLEHPEKSPVLLLPPCFNLHKTGNHVVFINEQWLFVIRGEEPEK